MQQTIARHSQDVQRHTLIAMLRDGLARRQPELPARFQWQGDDALRREWLALPEPRLGAVERELLSTLSPITARALVHILPASVGATREAAAMLIDAPASARYVAIDAPLTITAELPLPNGLERPRLFVCQGNALGHADTIGAVRLLRATRAGMRAGDRLVLGVDTRTEGPVVEEALNDAAGMHAAYYRSVLAAVNRELDTDFDPQEFDFQARYVADQRRVDLLLVSRRRQTVLIDGMPYSVRRRQAIRAGVHLCFTRSVLSAMLHAVGLAESEWRADAGERYAVALVTVATQHSA